MPLAHILTSLFDLLRGRAPAAPEPQQGAAPPLPHVLVPAPAPRPTPIDASALDDAPPAMWAEPRINSGVPDEALALSKVLEGFRPRPYLCSGNVWTYGYGSTRDLKGQPVTRDTPPITEAQAQDLARRDLARAARQLALDFPAGLPPRWWAVGVLMNNNLGQMSMWGRTLMAHLRAERWHDAANQMRHYRLADGKPSLGLRRRRWCEAAYALGMSAPEAHRRAWTSINTTDDWPPLPTT